MTKSITTGDIDKRLAAIDAKNTSLGFEAEELALASVSGDNSASGQLAQVRQQIAANLAEAQTLELAKSEAGRLEQAGRDRLNLDYRRQQAAVARQCAADMRDVASKLDAMQFEFIELYGQMQRLEHQIKLPLSRLEIPSEGRTGQGGLAQMAVAYFGAVDLPSYQMGWSVSKGFDSAWSHILELEIE